MEDVLGFCALVLTVLMTVGVVVWFCCSVVESVMSTRRRLQNSDYGTLLRENRRLKSFLAQAEEENSHLRYRLKRVSYPGRNHRGGRVRQRVA